MVSKRSNSTNISEHNVLSFLIMIHLLVFVKKLLNLILKSKHVNSLWQ